MNKYLWTTKTGLRGHVIAKDLTDAIAQAKTEVDRRVSRGLAEHIDLISVVCKRISTTYRKVD